MNIYVGNLSYNVTEENLRQAFEAFGQVSSATIAKDKYSSQPRGFGFVEMPEQPEAQAAINNLNGKELLGQRMNVNEAYPRTGRGRSEGQSLDGKTIKVNEAQEKSPRGAPESVAKKLFVAGLNWDTTDDGLRQAFAPYGEITEVKVITDHDTGHSRGFGFVTFAQEEDAKTAISKMDGTSLDGKTIKVDQAQEKSFRGGGRSGGGFGGGRASGRNRW
jgi:RNA recognition motif-containing protein